MKSPAMCVASCCVIESLGWVLVFCWDLLRYLTGVLYRRSSGRQTPSRPVRPKGTSAIASATRFTGVGTREQAAGDGGVLCFCMHASLFCPNFVEARRIQGFFFWPTQEAGALLARLRCPCPSPTPTMSSGRAWTLRVVATPINELIYCYGYYFLFGTDQFIFFSLKKINELQS